MGGIYHERNTSATSVEGIIVGSSRFAGTGVVFCVYSTFDNMVRIKIPPHLNRVYERRWTKGYCFFFVFFLRFWVLEGVLESSSFVFVEPLSSPLAFFCCSGSSFFGFHFLSNFQPAPFIIWRWQPALPGPEGSAQKYDTVDRTSMWTNPDDG